MLKLLGDEQDIVKPIMVPNLFVVEWISVANKSSTSQQTQKYHQILTAQETINSWVETCIYFLSFCENMGLVIMTKVQLHTEANL